MTNPVTKDRRHFEDLSVGEVITLGATRVSKEMIITFAREFDPFPFHLDEKAARESLLGGLRDLHADDDELLAAAGVVFDGLYVAARKEAP